MGKTSIKYALLRIVGLCFCIFPVTLSILFYFPIWGSRGGEAALSGFGILLLALAAVPLFKLLKMRISSISVHTLWFIIFVLFFVAARIANEMTVISFFGFVGNLIGALCFKIGDRCAKG